MGIPPPHESVGERGILWAVPPPDQGAGALRRRLHRSVRGAAGEGPTVAHRSRPTRPGLTIRRGASCSSRHCPYAAPIDGPSAPHDGNGPPPASKLKREVREADQELTRLKEPGPVDDLSLHGARCGIRAPIFFQMFLKYYVKLKPRRFIRSDQICRSEDENIQTDAPRISPLHPTLKCSTT